MSGYFFSAARTPAATGEPVGSRLWPHTILRRSHDVYGRIQPSLGHGHALQRRPRRPTPIIGLTKGLHAGQRAQQRASRTLRRLQPDHAHARARRATGAPRAQQLRHPHARRAAQHHLLCEVVGGASVSVRVEVDGQHAEVELDVDLADRHDGRWVKHRVRRQLGADRARRARASHRLASTFSRGRAPRAGARGAPAARR